MLESLQVLIIFAVLSFVLLLARKPAKYFPDRQLLLLDYSKGLIIAVVFICTVLPIGLFTAIALKGGLNSSSDRILFTILIAFFAALGIYLFLRFTREKIILSQEGISASYPFGKPRSLAWNEIMHVKYSIKGKYLIFESIDNRKIRISILLSGFPALCEFAGKRIAQEIYGDQLSLAANDKFTA